MNYTDNQFGDIVADVERKVNSSKDTELSVISYYY